MAAVMRVRACDPLTAISEVAFPGGRPRLIGELADSSPERSDTDGIVAEEARRLVESLNLPVDLIAHRDGMARRRPASSCDT